MCLRGRVRYLSDAAPDFVDGAEAMIAGGHHAIEFVSGGLTLYTIGDAPRGAGHAVIRAEEVLVDLRRRRKSSARNEFEGVVSEVATTGALTRVTVDVSSGAAGVIAPRVPIVAALTTRSAQALELREGQRGVGVVQGDGGALCLMNAR